MLNKETNTNNNKPTIISKSPMPSPGSNQSNIKENQSNKQNNSAAVYELIDEIEQKYDNSSIIPILKDEANQVELLAHHKDKLNSVNLIESKTDDLYDWKTLFNHSRPISAYTRLNSAKDINRSNNGNEKDVTIQERMLMQNPVALIDAPNEVISTYLPNYEQDRNYSSAKHNMPDGSNSYSNNNDINPNGDNSNSRIIRPKSMYCPRRKMETFYFSKDFSDYYNEELSAFSKKMPLVKSRVHIDKTKFNKVKHTIRSQSIQKEATLKSIRDNANLAISDHDVVLAGNSGNSIPLLESIFLQIHPDYVENVQKKKYYRNTAKPLGDNTNREDYSINCRDMHRYQIKAMRKECNSRRSSSSMGIKYNWYDENDPSVKMFMNIIINADKRKGERMIKEGEGNQENNKKEEDFNDFMARKRDMNEEEHTDRSTINKNMRPRTGFVRQDTAAIMKKRKFSGKKKRPQSSQIIKRDFMHIHFNPNCRIADINSSSSIIGCSHSQRNTCDNSLIASEFIPVKCLPIKTSSLIRNKTYQKINQSIKKKRDEKAKFRNSFHDIEKCSSSLLEIIAKSNNKNNNNNGSNSTINDIRKKQMKAYNEKAAQYNSNTEKETTSDYAKLKQNLGTNKNWMKVNLIYFNDYIVSNINAESFKAVKEETNVMNPINYYNKNAKEYYSKKRKEPMFTSIQCKKNKRVTKVS